MPQVIAPIISYGIGAAAGAAGITISTVAGTMAATIATVVSYAATVGASIAYSAAQGRKLRKSLGQSAASDQGRNVMARDSLAPWEYVYGEVPKSGPITYMQTTGTKNEYLHLIITLAHHECEALGEIKFSKTIIPLDGSGNATGTYAGYVRIKKFLGIAAGERDLDLESESGGAWTSADVGKNVARLHVRLKHNPDLFTDGIPIITCMVKGKKVYDPRSGLTVWSDNAALCANDWLCDPYIGKAVPQARVVEADLIEAANVSDETIVTLTGTEARYTTNGVARAGDADATLGELLAACAGKITDPGGKWVIRVGAWRPATLVLGENELLSDLEVIPRQSLADTYNRVRGTYISPENDWQPTDFPLVKNDTYTSWDNGIKLAKDVTYNFVKSSAQAQRLAKIDLEEGRQQVFVSGEFSLKAMQCQSTDVIGIDWEALGWSAKDFEVTRWGFIISESEESPDLRVRVSGKETAEGVYDWNDGEETAIDLAPNVILYDPRTVVAPTSLACLSDSTTTILQGDGTVVPSILVTWDLPPDEFIRLGGLYRIQYKTSVAPFYSEWNTVSGLQNFDSITDVVIGTTYLVRIRSENEKGATSGWSTPVSVTVAGDTSAPAAPTTLTAIVGTGKLVELDWDDNTELDFGEYEIYRNTVNNFGTSVYVGSVRASKFIDANVTIGTTYYYWVVAVDRSENSSIPSAVASATPTTVGATSVDLTPPPDPGTPTFNGDGTYLTNDGTALAFIDFAVFAPAGAQKVINILRRSVGGTIWQIDSQTAVGGIVRVDDLSPAKNYEFAVQAISAFGIASNVVVSSPTSYTAPSTTTAPTTPGNLTVTPGTAKNLELNWLPPSNTDVNYYEIYKATVNSIGSASLLGRVQGTRFNDVSVSYGTTYYYWVRAVNRSGVTSSFTTSSNGAATRVDTGDLENGAVETVKLAYGSVSFVAAIQESTVSGLTNGAWTQVADLPVGALAGQDVTLDISFGYADDGAAFTTSFEVRLLRDGTQIYSADQTVRQGNTELIAFNFVDPDLAGSVSVYTLEILPLGGGGSATPSARSPYFCATVLKDREN